MKERRFKYFRSLHAAAFLTAAVIFVVLSFIQFGELIDIHFHDTMFVISLNIICLLLAILCSIGFLIYRFLGFLMADTRLSWIHVFLSLVSFASLFVSVFLPEIDYSQQSLTSDDWKEISKRSNMIAFLVFGSFLLGQVVLVLNIVMGAFRKTQLKR